MSILKQLFGQRSVGDVVSPYPAGGGWWGPGMVWNNAPGGGWNNVNTTEAMRLSAVFACLRLLTDAISTLPIDTFRREGGVRRPYRPRPQWLDFLPPGESRIEFLSALMLSLLTDGNAFIAIARDALGEIVSLTVIDPSFITTRETKGRLRFFNPKGDELTPWYDILHIKGMCLPGAKLGISPIGYARETIGLGLAVQRFGSKFFENGALPAAVVEAPGKVSKESAELFMDTWNGNHKGVGNAHKVGFLTNGATLNKVSLQPNDSQFIETRAFQVPDIARIFGVPPHLIADASNSTSWGSGLAEQNLAFGQFSLRPWLERIEEQLSRLLTIQGMPDVFVKLNLDALLRASLKDRYDSYATGIEKRIILSEEARALEDLPPLPARVDTGDIEAVGALIRAGFDPADACRVLGLPAIKHTGTLPVTLQQEGI